MAMRQQHSTTNKAGSLAIVPSGNIPTTTIQDLCPSHSLSLSMAHIGNKIRIKHIEEFPAVRICSDIRQRPANISQAGANICRSVGASLAMVTWTHVAIQIHDVHRESDVWLKYAPMCQGF